MRRLGVRALMVVVGIAVLVGYLLAAYLGYQLLLALWTDRPDGRTTVLVVGGLTVAFGVLSYRMGTKRLLASLDATPIPRSATPNLYAAIDDLSERMELSPPPLFVADLEVPNAMALGGVRTGTLVFDRRLFFLLGPEEVVAVVAHELAHVESHDSLVQTLAVTTVQTLVGLVTFALVPALLFVTGVARASAWMWGRPERWASTPFGSVRFWVGQLVVIVFVLLTMLVRAHSRRREYAADDRAVEVTGDPLALARALRKIERASDPRWGLLSTLYIRGDEEGLLTRLLSTHPPMDDRVARLVERARRDERPVEGRRIPVR